MKIRMKESKKGSPDGVLVFDYKKGKTYDPPESLANAFIRAGWAMPVKVEEPEETKVIEPDETKVIEPDETKDEGLEEPKVEAPPETKKKDKK